MSRQVAPHDLGAEQSLIGAALLRQQVVEMLKATVDPSDFYRPLHGHAWAAMLDLHDQGIPIDIVTVAHALHDFDDQAMSVLAEAQGAVPAVSAAQRYADIVVETSRRRKLMSHLSELAQRCYDESADHILADLDTADHLIARRDGEIVGLSTLGEFVAATQAVEDQGEWLIPHILRPRWRVMIVAAEGVGKGTLMRFLGLHAAAGRDPWLPSKRIMPRQVLYIDTENPNTTILHQVRIANLDVDFVDECADQYSIWHREGGLNLRDRRTRAEMEAVLQRTRPEIVFAGPLYKLTRRKSGEDMEQATIELFEVLDDFRTRYNFALVIEHHAPKGNGGGYREMNPFGSSALLRWPEFGITLEEEGNALPSEDQMTLRVGRFRRDRERADWPDTIMRGQLGQRFAWTGRWPQGRNRFHWPY